jgi:hypothetical protein
MNLSSLASSAFATTRSTFKGLAEAAVASGEGTAPGRDGADERAEKTSAAAELKAEVRPAGRADSTEVKPKGVRRGTVLDAYA